MTELVVAILLGIVTGMRTMAAPTAVSVAARLGAVDLSATWAAWLGGAIVPWVLGLFALAELVLDKLPSTPSRKQPTGFAARVLAGMLAGGAMGGASGAAAGGAIAGGLGAVAGTFAGYALRMRMARAFGRDRPAALIEDAIAYVGAAAILWASR